MNSIIEIKDRIKLNFDVKKFHINQYIDGNPTYTFNSVKFNIPENIDKSSPSGYYDASLSLVPIILSGYEEEIDRIIVENNKKIAYTRFFRIDVSNAIKENEIIINDISYNKNKQRDKQCLENFAERIFECNENYTLGFITPQERINQLLDSFSIFYITMFKDGIQQLRMEEAKLPDEVFFSRIWKRFVSEEDVEEKVDDISFIWNSRIDMHSNWVNQFILEGISRGIDKKTNIKTTFGGIFISRKKFSEEKRTGVTLNISPSLYFKNTSTYNVRIFGGNTTGKQITTKDLWNNIEFHEMLKTIVESPIY